VVRACCGHTDGGTAKDGSPFFVERLGAADLAGFAREPEVLDLMYDSYVAYLEGIFRTVRACAAATGTFSRCLIVVDAAELSMSTMRHIGIIKAVSKIGPPNFPEGSSKVLIVNAPMIFSAMWTIVSPLLPKRTRAKVSISSSRWTSTTLLELIDAKELPQFLGGERSTADPHVARTELVPEGVKIADSEAVGAAAATSPPLKAKKIEKVTMM